MYKPALYQQESYVFEPKALPIPGVEERLRGRLQRKLWPNSTACTQNCIHGDPLPQTRRTGAFAKGESAPVDAELAGMLRQAADFARKSDQLFNPAVGNLVALWGFHRDTYKPVVPDAAKLTVLKAMKPSLDDLS